MFKRESTTFDENTLGIPWGISSDAVGVLGTNFVQSFFDSAEFIQNFSGGAFSPPFAEMSLKFLDPESGSS
jgi:hypothetical protein